MTQPINIDACPYCGSTETGHNDWECYGGLLVRLANLNWRLAVDLQKEEDKLLYQSVYLPNASESH